MELGKTEKQLVAIYKQLESLNNELKECYKASDPNCEGTPTQEEVDAAFKPVLEMVEKDLSKNLFLRAVWE